MIIVNYLKKRESICKKKRVPHGLWLQEDKKYFIDCQVDNIFSPNLIFSPATLYMESAHFMSSLVSYYI
ncbi:hypothetical protein D0T50_03880 [Bacteroides sp. 214]|nr:hypothetical protein [Bacteroides sp. 214]